MRKHGSLKVVVWLFAFGALWVLPYGARDLLAHAPEVTADTWLLVLFIVLFATVFTYLVNAWALGRAPAYLYYWTWESPAEGGKYRAQHTIDIAFAFDNVEASRLTAGAAGAQALADQVSEAFIAFFRTGDPNTPKSRLPQWPKFEPGTRPTMVFNTRPELKNDPIREQRLAMWDAMGLMT